MGEEATSWIWRTNFSRTVFYRLDPSKLDAFPLSTQSEKISALKSRHASETAASSQKSSTPAISQIQRNAITYKQRSLSPLPQTVLSDTFKEARSDRMRFSTPNPRRKDHDKGLVGKFFRKEPHETRSGKSSSNTSPLKHFASTKAHKKSRSKKDSAWTKYFDHGGGKVNAVETADEWTLDMSKLFIGLRFAHGANSRLYHGVYKDEPVAVKIIRVPDDDESGILAARLEKQFNREVALLSRLHHPNVIKFVAACKNSPVYCVITEYLSEGSLRAYLHKLQDKSLPLRKLTAMALDIARGMEYIHSHGVIHRDLKPENVLISEEFNLKIADFGIACDEAYCDLLADDPGTYRWMAPEMIKKKSYGRKVDVYSFGLILWEMVAGTIPYEDMNPIQAAFAVVNKVLILENWNDLQNLRPVIPVGCPTALRILIEQCWSLQPEKRPEFWQIVKILEQFESSVGHDGTLNLAQNLTSIDPKKGHLNWIHKLDPANSNRLPTLKPKLP